MYNISSNPNELATINYRKNLSSELIIVEAVFMDETYIVLVFTRPLFSVYQFETRSFSTFDIISVIDDQLSFGAACFDYQRGVICAVLHGGEARCTFFYLKFFFFLYRNLFSVLNRFWNAAVSISLKTVYYKDRHAEGNTNSVEPFICNIK